MPIEQNAPRRERPQKDAPKSAEGDRRGGTDARNQRRDNRGGAQTRAVVINTPSPADANKGRSDNRSDKKKPFETTDKKAKNKKTMMKEA